ncbi:HalOD1 output domain-containing protein [Haladaptatus halobius]|uniref:HalOD1 output domain-containing protein n=1 Tax=Haladaptatus halobius TaxID=2884875 RepID=UPI001D0B18F3
MAYVYARSYRGNEFRSPPLYDATDPDALNSVIASLDTGRVRFEYSNCHVIVTYDEIIDTATDN